MVDLKLFRKNLLSLALLVVFSFILFWPPTPVYSAGCGEFCQNWTECPEECPKCLTEPQLRGRKICKEAPISGENGVNFNINLDDLLGTLPIGIFGDWQSLTIGTIVSEVLPYIFVLAGLALLLMLIFGGFQLMTSAGDPKGMEAGKNRVMYAIIGFLIIFASFWLVQILQVIFGLPKIF